jgi:pimeloyl-ACP methyl ester carboxylesterase
VIRGLLEHRDGHLRLRCSPAWEARIYATAVWNDLDLRKGLPALGVPTLIIRGAESDTLTEAACRAASRANHSLELGTVEGATHLVPLERPLEVHAMWPGNSSSGRWGSITPHPRWRRCRAG